MNNVKTCHRPEWFLIVLLFLQVIIYVTILIDIPVARQVVGFLYFTFVPGFVIVKLLKMNQLDSLETVLLSAGFSIAFLMLIGFFTNELGFLLGFLRPLSLMPTLLILNGFTLIGGFFVYLRKGDAGFLGSNSFNLSPFALIFVCLPILSVIGTTWVNVNGSNLLLLCEIVTISLLLVVGVISKKLLPPNMYPFALFMIALAILYQSSLISNYITNFGSDVPIEYFAFKTTQNNLHWSSSIPYFWDTAYGRINSMLSVTIVPTLYSELLNLDGTRIFKILIPLIFSLVPLGMYQLIKGYVKERYAFLSVFLFIAQSTFYTEMLGLNRQIISELFFVLLLFVVLSEKLKPSNKIICFVIFSVALIMSHYALAEIFLFFISFALVFLFVLKKPSRNITASMTALFLVLMCAWYIYTSGSAVFDSFLSFGNGLSRQLGDFFNPASRGQTVLTGLGLGTPQTVWNAFSRMFAYTTEILIVVGFFGLITKRKNLRFGKEHFLFILIGSTLLVLLIVVPGLANTLNMSRFYHILLILLAPLCAIGAEVIVKLVSKSERELETLILLLIVLVPYFLFQTGFVYEISKSDSFSLPLSKQRMDTLRLYLSLGYIDVYSATSAQWLSRNINVENTQFDADLLSRDVLSIYSTIYQNRINVLSNITTVESGNVVYLNELNVVYGKIVANDFLYNSDELHPIFGNLNMIYNSGGSQLLKNGQ